MIAIPEALIYFLVVCAAFALTSTACRTRDWRRILHESQHLVVMITVGIAILAGIIFAVEKFLLG